MAEAVIVFQRIYICKECGIGFVFLHVGESDFCACGTEYVYGGRNEG